jgi:hypothetical protein
MTTSPSFSSKEFSKNIKESEKISVTSWNFLISYNGYFLDYIIIVTIS